MSRRMSPLEPVHRTRQRRSTPVEVAALVVLVSVTAAVVALSVAVIAWALSTL